MRKKFSSTSQREVQNKTYGNESSCPSHQEEKSTLQCFPNNQKVRLGSHRSQYDSDTYLAVKLIYTLILADSSPSVLRARCLHSLFAQPSQPFLEIFLVTGLPYEMRDVVVQQTVLGNGPTKRVVRCFGPIPIRPSPRPLTTRDVNL